MTGSEHLTNVGVDRVQQPLDRAASLTVGATVERECPAGDDKGECQVLGAESPFALIGDSQQGDHEKPCEQQRQSLADRFRNSADLAIGATRIDTATKSKPSSAAVAAPIITAKSPQPVSTAFLQNGPTT